MTEIIGSGLAFPLQVDRRGGIALARDEQDIDQAIQLILGTAPGERPMRPEFGCGVHDFVFDSIDANTVGRMEDAIRTALERWEPRIDVSRVEIDARETMARDADGWMDRRADDFLIGAAIDGGWFGIVSGRQMSHRFPSLILILRVTSC